MPYRPLWPALCFALAFGAFASQAQAVLTLDLEPGACAADETAVTLVVENVAVGRGMIRAALYDNDPEHFTKSEAALVQAAAPAREGETELCLPVSQPGTYAITVFHDQNSNGKLEKNFIGLPTEPWGISNNPPFRLSRPKLAEAAFEVPEGGTTTRITVDVKR